MPELPDLLYIQEYARREICSKVITDVHVKQPIILRIAVDSTFEDALRQKSIDNCTIHGPFLTFELSEHLELITNLMVAGNIQHQQRNEKPEGHLCFSLSLDDGSCLNFCDEQKMAKVYLIQSGLYDQIPQYREQGVDIRGSAHGSAGGFTVQVLKDLAAKHSRKQVRVFINDHTILSSIGNAYADEILFDAKIHPKTFVARLSNQEIERLHNSIISVMEWGIEQVKIAAKPIHVKVRDHMNVRNRKGKPCPRCGTIIRREGVRGFDVFFCPQCQPVSRNHFIDWSSTPE